MLTCIAMKQNWVSIDIPWKQARDPAQLQLSGAVLVLLDAVPSQQPYAGSVSRGPSWAKRSSGYCGP